MVNSNQDIAQVEAVHVDAVDYALNVVKISPEEKADIDMLTLRRDNFSYETPARKRKLRRRTKTRAVYGLGDKDWINASYFVGKAIVNVLRAHPSQSADVIVNDLVMLNDAGDSFRFDSVPGSTSEIKSYDDWKHFVSKMVNGIIGRWFDNYSTVLQETAVSPVSDSEYEHDLALIRSLPTRPEASWVQWRGVITDPTASYLSELAKKSEKDVYRQIINKHKQQRSLFGISNIDMEHAKLSYAHWILVNASITLASSEAMGYPASKDWNTWSRELLTFAEGIYIAGFAGQRELSAEDIAVRDEAIRNMPVYFNNLWD